MVHDPNAQTPPLTKGQQIEDQFGAVTLVEPGRLAEEVDKAIAAELGVLATRIIEWEQLGRELITAWHGGDIQKASMYGLVVKAEGMLTNAPDD